MLKGREAFYGSLRWVEVEVHVRLELGEWLAEIGWVLSVAGVVSIESPLAHSKTELTRTSEHCIAFFQGVAKPGNDMII